MARDEIRYTEEHCWVRMEEEGHVACGLTEYSPSLQQRIMRVELPEVGDEITRDEECGQIECGRAVFDFIAPISGTVVDVNDEVTENPALLMDDPYEDGWLLYVKLAHPAEWRDLLTHEGYKELREEQEEGEIEDEYEDDLFEEYE